MFIIIYVCIELYTEEAADAASEFLFCYRFLYLMVFMMYVRNAY